MQWVALGIKILPLVISAVQFVERLIKGEKKGAEKHAEVRQFILDLLTGSEGLTGRDLLNDEAVSKLIDNVIIAVVAAQNGIAAWQKLRPQPVV